MIAFSAKLEGDCRMQTEILWRGNWDPVPARTDAATQLTEEGIRRESFRCQIACPAGCLSGVCEAVTGSKQRTLGCGKLGELRRNAIGLSSDKGRLVTRGSFEGEVPLLPL